VQQLAELREVPRELAVLRQSVGELTHSTLCCVISLSSGLKPRDERRVLLEPARQLLLDEVVNEQNVARHDLVRRIIVDWLQECASASGRKR
jgi:hypothetical protein